MKFLIIFLLALFFYNTFNLTFGTRGLLKSFEISNEIKEQQKLNKAWQKNNNDLVEKIILLKTNDSYVEFFLRRDFYWIGKDEKFIFLEEKKQ